MKIMTVLGTRPEIIRLSVIIPLLDKYLDHKVVYTGQNYDPNLKEVFFRELKLRDPDYSFDCKSSTAMGQVAIILSKTDEIFKREKPDKVLILGDTNSAMCSYVAKRIGIPIYHMEAGNRCFDDRVPEEVNRRVIDHCSNILMPYTERSRDNLLNEGIPSKRIYVTGNPIYEVITKNYSKENDTLVLNKYQVKKNKFFLLTLHREENVDQEDRLKTFMLSFEEIVKQYDLPVLFSVHPRTRNKLDKMGLKNSDKIVFLDPLPFYDFLSLEMSAFCVLTDSGTVQEETCIYKIPCVTLRDTTERPETVEVGSNLITGCDIKSILNSVKIAVETELFWQVPYDYDVGNVSEKVLKIMMSNI